MQALCQSAANHTAAAQSVLYCHKLLNRYRYYRAYVQYCTPASSWQAGLQLIAVDCWDLGVRRPIDGVDGQ